MVADEEYDYAQALAEHHHGWKHGNWSARAIAERRALNALIKDSREQLESL